MIREYDQWQHNVLRIPYQIQLYLRMARVVETVSQPDSWTGLSNLENESISL